MVCLLGLVALLRTGDRPDEPAPEPAPTTTTTGPPDLSTLQWLVTGDERNTHRLSAVHDLERDRPVLQLQPRPGAVPRGDVLRAGIGRDEDVQGAGRVTFTADVKVVGAGRAGIYVESIVLNVGTGGEARVQAHQGTIDERPVTEGGWVRRSVTIDAVDGTSIFFGAVIEGDGTLLVDPIAIPE